MNRRIAAIGLAGVLVVTIAGAQPALAPVASPAAATPKVVPRVAKVVDMVAAAKKAFPKLTLVREYEVGFGRGLDPSIPAALTGGKATFSTSRTGWVIATIDAKPNSAYGIRCVTTATPQVKLDTDRPPRPPTDGRTGHDCTTRTDGSGNLVGPNKCAALVEADAKGNVIKTMPPSECNYLGTEASGYGAYGYRAYKFSCPQTKLGLAPKRTETMPVWTVALLDGATWKTLDTGTDEQPHGLVVPPAGAVRIKIAYDITGKKSDTTPCAQTKTILLAPDPRPEARYPRIVDTCGEGIVQNSEDLRWDLASCTVSEFAVGK